MTAQPSSCHQCGHEERDGDHAEQGGQKHALHRGALVATGVVLFVFILLITMLFNVIKKRGETR